MTLQTLFNAQELRDLLSELGDRIAKRGETVDAYIVGGTAIAIGLNLTRRFTEDVDGIFRPLHIALEEAKEMAKEHNLREDWLNGHSTPFIMACAGGNPVREGG